MPDPNCKPGFQLVKLTGDVVADKAAMEAAAQSGPGYNPVGFYTAGGNTIAVFTRWYYGEK